MPYPVSDSSCTFLIPQFRMAKSTAVIAAGLGLSLVIFLLGLALSLIPDPAFSPALPTDSSSDDIELSDLKTTNSNQKR